MEEQLEEVRMLPGEISFLLEPINEQICELQDRYSQEELNEHKPFELSVGAITAMGILNGMDERQFYLDRGGFPCDNIVWVFRVYFQFTGRTLPFQNEQAWQECKDMFRKVMAESTPEKSFSDFFIEAAHNFNFSNENLDLVEELIQRKEDMINPKVYTLFCPMTALFMFAVREACVFGSLIPGRICISKKYQRLLYKKNQLETKLKQFK